MFKAASAGLGLLTLVASQPATAQSINDGTINLRASCSELKSRDDVRDCQQAFEAVAENVVKTQKNLLLAPHSIVVGRKEDPEVVMVNTPPRLAMQLTTHMNRACANIANRDQLDRDSQRLDDGSRSNLYRIAERALTCARTVETAAQIAQVPVPTSLVYNLRLNAQDVRGVTNKIAMRPD